MAVMNRPEVPGREGPVNCGGRSRPGQIAASARPIIDRHHAAACWDHEHRCSSVKLRACPVARCVVVRRPRSWTLPSLCGENDMNKLRNSGLPTEGQFRVARSTGRPPDLETVLRGLAWVQRLPERAQARVLEDCHDKTYQKGESVARMGEPSVFWIGVVEGLLKVSAVTFSGRSVMFTAVPEGSWVGEGSVIKRELRRYDLTAMRPTRVVLVPRATFLWLLETDHGFSRYIIDHLNERTGQFLSMLEVSRMSSPVARLAGAICNLYNPVL